MLTTIQPSVIKGTILAPTSKSSMQRACAAALLTGGETIIHNPGNSNDDQAAIGVIRALGALVEVLEDGSLKVRSAYTSGSSIARVVNCGESGLGIRMFAPIIALSDQPVTVNGEGSLLTRPLDFFDEIFPQLGIQVASHNGRLPLLIQGPLKPRNIAIDGSLSSQFLTGLLMAFAAAGAADVSIRVNNLKSKPYIDLTLQVMRHFGWQVENRNYEEFYFPIASVLADAGLTVPANAGLSPSAGSGAEVLSYTVEGDWSGGAFLLVAGAISGRITIKGLDIQSTQADKAILQALSDCGAGLSIRDREIEIGPGPLKAFHFNATDCPDLFPPLVALASFCAGTTVIGGVSRLAHKESNRGLTLQEEFAKMGVSIDLQDDLMLIKGGNGIKGATVHSRHDHRIAMACAVAALRSEGDTTIEEAQAINKSYPDFYAHLQKLGAQVRILEEAGNTHGHK
ncbi:3-phosphoshikimate 1-carboxyvinyltransferase [Flavitalea flava]